MPTTRLPIFRSPEKLKTTRSPPSSNHKITPKSTFALLFTLLLFSLLLFSFNTQPHHHHHHKLLHHFNHRYSAVKPAVCPAGILPFYITPLPPKFNSDLLSNCTSLNSKTNMCPYITNLGLGNPLAEPAGVEPRGSTPFEAAWFDTSQFASELIFHNRAIHHPCRVPHPSAAKLFYVPFYAGLWASSVSHHRNLTHRDSLAVEFGNYVTSLPSWKPNSGRDHFLVSGRTAWDFLRSVKDARDYGANTLFNLPAVKKMTVLTVEQHPWKTELRQLGIPYPSYFHPTSSEELTTWQEHVLATHRPHLFSFIGATRRKREKAAIRDKIIEQCAVSSKCNLLDCSSPSQAGLCYDPSRVIRVMEGSAFCLQPPGDSFTRRSVFDAILAGCIPVFFSKHTAYSQYKWYLPSENDSYSVFIDAKSDDVMRIEAILAAIPEDKMEKMRENVVKRVLPRVTYMHPKDRVGDDMGLFDVVDIALKALSDDLNAKY